MVRNKLSGKKTPKKLWAQMQKETKLDIKKWEHSRPGWVTRTRVSHRNK